MKIFNLLTLPTAAIALCMVGCSNPAPVKAPVDMAALTAKVQAMEDAYAAATIKKDAAAVVDYYADDLISYSRDEAPTKGKEAMRQRLADRMAKDSLNYEPTYTVVELFVADDHITEIGSWVDKEASGSVRDQGTYFSIFQKRGDKWVCTRDISVSHMPKKEAMPVAAVQ